MEIPVLEIGTGMEINTYGYWGPYFLKIDTYLHDNMIRNL
jgi:hypothetical protein